MPNISGALKSYRYLLRYRYKFSISSNKRKYDISLTFNEYYGARAYWLYKSRIFLENGEEMVLYNRFLEEKSSRPVKKQ